MGIPVADAVFIKPEDNVFEMNIDFPVIAKPNYGDSSVAITADNVANNFEELNDAIIRIREKVGFDKPIIVEEFLPGKEITIGIIGNPPESYTVLPFAEEDYSALPANCRKFAVMKPNGSKIHRILSCCSQYLLIFLKKPKKYSPNNA